MKNDESKSVVPSRMKRKQDIDITEKQPLKARVRTVVFTNQNESSDHAIEEHKEIVSTNHVTAEEVSNPDEEIETDEAPKTLEDGGQETMSVDLPGEDVFNIEILPPWEMYFDGVARQDGAGAGVVFVSPEKHVLPYSFVLTQLCSNNMAEYQALIMGLQMAVEMEIQDLDVYGDSQLVISQLLGEYEVKKEDLIPYHKHASRLLDKFDIVKLSHVPRSANKMADALAGLAATLTLGAEEIMFVPVCNRWVVAPEEYEVEDDEVEEVDMITVCQIDKEDWRQPIIDYLEHQKLPNDPRHRTEIRRRASRFILF
uniref:RNase H type-1 domain-containing protein n=1 Tax=Chenopodium quinoa TaxID=63459 RepID=A0A803L4J8_CHEQI